MGVGGGVVREGSADITACQGDISFAMNHGPEEGRGWRARRQHFSSFPPLKKKQLRLVIVLFTVAKLVIT